MFVLEAAGRIELPNRGFADLRLTTWLRRLGPEGKTIEDSSRQIKRPCAPQLAVAARPRARRLGIAHQVGWLTSDPAHNMRLGSAYLAQIGAT